jgi:hypothetical protein
LRRKRGGDLKDSYLTPEEQMSQQHPTDRAAVLKYLRKRDRAMLAEKAKNLRELEASKQEEKTKQMMNKLQSGDTAAERERERQMEKIKMKLQSKNNVNLEKPKNDQEVASGIIKSYNNTQLQ